MCLDFLRCLEESIKVSIRNFRGFLTTPKSRIEKHDPPPPLQLRQSNYRDLVLVEEDYQMFKTTDINQSYKALFSVRQGPEESFICCEIWDPTNRITRGLGGRSKSSIEKIFKHTAMVESYSW